jgi:hypothetical protein
MDLSIGTLILFALNIWTAVMSLRTAERRGRSGKVWMWLGILFGPFAWATVALLPPIRKQSAA